MERRGRRRPTASKVVELWPKMLPLLSSVVESKEGGHVRRAENHRSVGCWPPKLATPRGGRVRVGDEGKTPAAASDQKQREEKGGPWGGGWMGSPVDIGSNI
jgi:hypothetical protein